MKNCTIRKYRSASALHQKKNNFGPALPPLGFELNFSHERVHIGSYHPTDEPECDDKLPVASRIRNLLEDGAMRTAEQIADDLHLRLATVKSVLSREKGRKWQMFGGAGAPTQYSVLGPR